MSRLWCVAAIASIGLWQSYAASSATPDWTGFGGPNGNFQLTGPALAWPPKLLWSRPLGEGYSPIIASGGELYTMYRRGSQEVIASLDAATGKPLWEYVYEAPLPGHFDGSSEPGPRASPLIVGDRLFAVGINGKMHCLKVKNGELLWARDFAADFAGVIRNSGYSPSPLAWHDSVIVFPNGPDAAVASLRQSDGAVIWKKHSFTVSYSSPILISFDGREQMVALFSDEVTGLDPATGDLLWSHPHTNNQKVNVAQPVWGAGLLFLTSAYDGGCRTIRLLPGGKTEEVWTHRLVRVHHSDAVRIGDTVYAASGDFGPTPLSAVDIRTGKILWRDRTFPKASLVAVGDQLLILDEEGSLGLAKPAADGLHVEGKLSALTSTAWTPPTVIGKRVYVRDRKTIAAYSFGE